MSDQEIVGDMGDTGQNTSTPPFETIRAIVEASPPPRRLNRNMVDGWLDELDAWDAASDEALEAFARLIRKS